MKKLKYAWMTFLPMVFMFVTTFVASYKLFRDFLEKASSAPENAFVFQLDAAIIVIMAMLAVIALFDSIHKWYTYLAGKRGLATSESPGS